MIDTNLWTYQGTKPHRRNRDASLMTLDLYARPCARCGTPFQIAVPHGRTSKDCQAFFAIHCKAHVLSRAEVELRRLEGVRRAKLARDAEREQREDRAQRWAWMAQALRRGLSRPPPEPTHIVDIDRRTRSDYKSWCERKTAGARRAG